MPPTIARVWRARANRDRLDSYREHFTTAVLPILERLPGFRGATILESLADQATTGDVEIIVISRWDSIEHVRAFAGDDLNHAVVDADAQACLTWFEDRVVHFNISLDT